MVECVDVRLGSDGRVQCPVVDNVYRVIMNIRLLSNDEQYVYLYNDGQNFSTNKYIITEDFSAVIVTNVTVSDVGGYYCSMSATTGGGNSRFTTLSVYGKQLP